MKPRKSLGQNFLINVHAAQRIVQLLAPQPGDTIVEIGGGRGDLTVHLAATGAQIVVLELDRSLADLLVKRFADRPNLKVIATDVLQFDPASLPNFGENVKVVGNLPYNITSPILEWLIEHRGRFPEAVIMMQKEVALRLSASPGGKDFGSLTVFVQLFYEAERVFDLKPGSFFPAPKVFSSVVHLKRRSVQLVSDQEFPDLRRLTAACFRWRRKQLLRILREEYSLSPEVVARICEDLDISVRARPEQLAVAQFVELAKLLECHRSDRSPS